MNLLGDKPEQGRALTLDAPLQCPLYCVARCLDSRHRSSTLSMWPGLLHNIETEPKLTINKVILILMVCLYKPL